MTDTQTLIPTAEVAARLGVVPPTVSRMVRSGRLTPAAKLPGLRGGYLFDPADVERMAEESSC